jgi:alpha-galactosidase
MARVSGVALIVVGLSWPALTWPVPSLATTRIAPVFPGPVDAAAALAQTPPMGWNGFNRFYHDVSEARVEAEARAMVASGMQAAGYEYVNLDGGWDLLQRGPEGELQPDPSKFPHGIKPVADYVHSLGLKFGIYTSAGLTNCFARSAGSYGHFQQDAALFASWGVDYVKLDWCRVPYRNYPSMSHQEVSRMLAKEMGAAIATSGRAMVYDINFLADDAPWMWGPNLANMWRTGLDSQDRWSSMVFNFTHNVQHYSHARPGGWNDPDMLEIGNGGMTATEYQSEFSLWAEMAAPLIAGTDLTTMSDVTRSILTNQAVIAVDQDPLGLQGRPVANAGGHWVLVKPLVTGAVAVVLFNSTDRAAVISTTAGQVGMTRTYAYRMIDLWSHAESDTAGLISASVPAHGVVMYVVTSLASAN